MNVEDFAELWTSGAYWHGRVHVDFNLAYNPYCAYNDAFSSPLPPPENWLRVPIPAGEARYAR